MYTIYRRVSVFTLERHQLSEPDPRPRQRDRSFGYKEHWNMELRLRSLEIHETNSTVKTSDSKDFQNRMNHSHGKVAGSELLNTSEYIMLQTLQKPCASRNHLLHAEQVRHRDDIHIILDVRAAAHELRPAAEGGLLLACRGRLPEARKELHRYAGEGSLARRPQFDLRGRRTPRTLPQ